MARSTPYILLLLSGLGCDDPAPAEPTPEEKLAQLTRELEIAEGTTHGVSIALEAAALSGQLDEEKNAQLRLLLERASRDPSVPRACEATLELARLQRRAELHAQAFRTAYQATKQYRDASCVNAAQSIVDALAAYRPSARELREMDEAAGTSGCTLERVNLLSSGERDARIALRFAAGDGRCAFTSAEREATDRLPARYRLELPSTRAGAALRRLQTIGRGGVRGIRVMPEGDGLVIALDLAEGAQAQHYQLESPFRIIVDVALPRSAPTSRRVVVLDPGHGGNEVGGHFDDLRESVLVMDIATRAAAEIRRQMPGVIVRLTREGDEPVSLDERAAMANAAEADLFVSIHLNAAEGTIRTGGVTTFVLDTSDDAQVARLAARENGIRPADITDMQRLLGTLHRDAQVRDSRRLAEQVHQHTLARGRRVLPELPDRGVKSSMFYVLVGARMPAVLVEASFMSKPEEAEALRSVAYRRELATGIAEGVLEYLSGPGQ